MSFLEVEHAWKKIYCPCHLHLKKKFASRRAEKVKYLFILEHRFFLSFVKMDKIGKEIDIQKEQWASMSNQESKLQAILVYPVPSPILAYFFSLVCAWYMTWGNLVTRIVCAERMHSKNGSYCICHQQLPVYGILPSAVIWHTTINCYMTYYHQQLYDILPSAVIWHTTIRRYMTY